MSQSTFQKSRNSISQFLYANSKQFHQEVPIREISAFLQSNGVEILDEEEKVFEGFLSGSNGRTTFKLRDKAHNKVVNPCLIMSWYQMPSGRYETISYLA